MHEHSIKKLFEMEGYVLTSLEQDAERIYVHCHVAVRGMHYEGEYSTQVNTTQVRTIRHMVLDRTVVWLCVTQRKFYFPRHKKRLWESLPGIQKGKQTSQLFRKETLLALQSTNFTGVAKKRGTSIMFPLRLLDALPPEQWCTEEEHIRRIGLDGKGVRKHQQLFTVTNLDEKKLLGVLPEQSQASLISSLKTVLPATVRESVQEVCIDMDMFFLKVIREVFPRARVVIDHFHVIAWGLHLLDQQKRILQNLSRERYQVKTLLAKPIQKLTEKEYQRLQEVFEQAPELKKSWKIIHQLRKIYWATSYTEARSQLRRTRWMCIQSHIPEMEQLAKTLTTWFDSILNYYLSHATNALTEGIHTKFELMKRAHFGIKNIPRFTKRLFYSFIPLSLLAHIFVQTC